MLFLLHYRCSCPVSSSTFALLDLLMWVTMPASHSVLYARCRAFTSHLLADYICYPSSHFEDTSEKQFGRSLCNKIKLWLHAHPSFNLGIAGNGSNEDVIARSSNQGISSVDLYSRLCVRTVWRSPVYPKQKSCCPRAINLHILLVLQSFFETINVWGLALFCVVWGFFLVKNCFITFGDN